MPPAPVARLASPRRPPCSPAPPPPGGCQAAVWLAATALFGQTVDRKVIILDPGHGGDDNGARSAAGTFEKDVNLMLAKALRKELSQDSQLQVLLTREGDQRLALEERAIHVNRLAGGPVLQHPLRPLAPGVGGRFLVYYFQPDADQTDTYHYLKTPLGGRELRVLPWNLAQFQWVPASKEMAGILQRRLNEFYSRSSGAPMGGPLKPWRPSTARPCSWKRGTFSNPADEQRLDDAGHQDALARVLRHGRRVSQGERTHPGDAMNRKVLLIALAVTLVLSLAGVWILYRQERGRYYRRSSGGAGSRGGSHGAGGHPG